MAQIYFDSAVIEMKQFTETKCMHINAVQMIALGKLM